MPSHFEFRSSAVTCSACRWHGVGRDCVTGEVFERGEVTEYNCPRCGERVGGAIPWPTVEEYRANWAALSAAERSYARYLEQRQRPDA